MTIEELCVLLQKLHPAMHCPQLKHFIAHRQDYYSTVADLDLLDHGEDSKTFLLKLLNKAECPDLPPQAHFLRKLQQELTKIKKVFDIANPVIEIAENKTRKNETTHRWLHSHPRRHPDRQGQQSVSKNLNGFYYEYKLKPLKRNYTSMYCFDF